MCDPAPSQQSDATCASASHVNFKGRLPKAFEGQAFWFPIHVHALQENTVSPRLSNKGDACHAQALPDFRGADAKGSGQLKQKSTQAAKEKIADYLSRGRATVAKTKKLNIKQKRLANKHSLQASDNALMGGLHIEGLSVFRVAHPPGPLGPTMGRFYIPMAGFPGPLQAVAHCRTRRSCIKDKDSGQTRLEVMWQLPRPSLHHCIDTYGVCGVAMQVVHVYTWWSERLGLERLSTQEA